MEIAESYFSGCGVGRSGDRSVSSTGGLTHCSHGNQLEVRWGQGKVRGWGWECRVQVGGGGVSDCTGGRGGRERGGGACYHGNIKPTNYKYNV